MENYEALASVWFWVIMAAITVLHILAVPLGRLDKTAQTVLTVLNAFMHILLIGYMLAAGGLPEELFFALLLSLTVALFTTKFSGKGAGKDGI